MSPSEICFNISTIRPNRWRLIWRDIIGLRPKQTSPYPGPGHAEKKSLERRPCHAVRTRGHDTLSGLAVRTRGHDMQSGHAARTRGHDTRPGHAVRTRDHDMRLGHAVRTLGQDMRPRHAVRTRSRDTQLGHSMVLTFRVHYTRIKSLLFWDGTPFRDFFAA